MITFESNTTSPSSSNAGTLSAGFSLEKDLMGRSVAKVVSRSNASPNSSRTILILRTKGFRRRHAKVSYSLRHWMLKSGRA